MGNKGEGRPSPFIRGITNRPLVAAVRRIRSIEILHWTRFPFEKSMPGQEPALNSRAATNGRRALLRGWVVVRTISGLFLFLLVAVPALSQTFRGGINGVITDQSGGVVPVAEIRATNEATGPLLYNCIFQRRGVLLSGLAARKLYDRHYCCWLSDRQSRWRARIGGRDLHPSRQTKPRPGRFYG